MKKIVILFAVLSLVAFSFSSCGKDERPAAKSEMGKAPEMVKEESVQDVEEPVKSPKEVVETEAGTTEQGMVEDVVEKVGDAVEEAKDKAGEIIEPVKEKVEGML